MWGAVGHVILWIEGIYMKMSAMRESQKKNSKISCFLLHKT